MIVKICGIRSVRDACLAAEAGCDWIGLNFWLQSPRYVTVENARDIAVAIGSRAQTVGVFVNAAREEIERVSRIVGLDRVQLHGDEPPELVQEFGERAIKAVRVRDVALIPLYAPALILLDGNAPGSGAQVDWQVARDLAQRYRLILAGGLTPENVALAIRAVRPFGVDVASGVEKGSQVKDVGRMRAFVHAAKQELS